MVHCYFYFFWYKFDSMHKYSMLGGVGGGLV